MFFWGIKFKEFGTYFSAIYTIAVSLPVFLWCNFFPFNSTYGRSSTIAVISRVVFAALAPDELLLSALMSAWRI